MKRKASWLIPLSLLVVTAISAVDADEGLKMNISPLQALAPVNLRVSVRVEPHADNRVLTIVADGGDFYRSSEIPLEGDRAPRVFIIEYPSLPGGEYQIKSALVNSMGRERAVVHRTAHVLATGGEP